jgi:5'-deoxynucleotidase YfbR-like HD superfamily hydrolase
MLSFLQKKMEGVLNFLRTHAWWREQREWHLRQDDNEIIRLAHEIVEFYPIKRVMRYKGERDSSLHLESDGDHVAGLMHLAEYFLPLEDPEEKLDWLLVHSMLKYHDIGEIDAGDLPYHLKTKLDEANEKEAAKAVIKRHPVSMQNKMQYCWDEFHKMETRESRIANALDKIEPLFELLHPVNETSLKRLKMTVRQHVVKKVRATREFPVMRRFVIAVTRDMFRRDVFWKPPVQTCT